MSALDNQIIRDTRHVYVDGGWVQSSSHGEGVSINPADGSRVGQYSAATRADAEAAVDAARRAFDTTSWGCDPRGRQMALLKWADALDARIEPLAHMLTLTNGKPLAQARGEISAAISEIRYYAGLARHNPGHAMEVAPGEFSVMLREPAGVAGLIIPWNAPAVLLVRSLAPALAVGCTVVIKVAPQTVLFSLEFLEPLLGLREIPAGTVNVFTELGSEAAEQLVVSPNVDVLSFTGSNNVGSMIMAQAAPTMKKLSLELGGKSCCVVMADADIEAIAPSLAAAATIISGQQCTAARRILVHESRLGEMRSALSAALKSMVVGDGRDKNVTMGPLIDTATRDKVAERIAAAERAADEVALAATIPDGLRNGAYLTPSVVVHSDETADFCQEEIFGPFVTVEPFRDENHAIEKANNTEFGLAASVWTRQADTAWRVGRALRKGTIWINDHNKLFAEAETGGYRKSGIGRLHGFDALLDFSELKHVYQNVCKN